MSANLENNISLAGRPPRDIDLARIHSLLDQHPMTQVAQIVGVHRNTLYNHLQNDKVFEAKRNERAFKASQMFVRHIARLASRAWLRQRYSPSPQPTTRGPMPKSINIESVLGMLKEKSVMQTARALGVHRNTLYNHLQNDVRFRQKVAGRQSRIESAQSEKDFRAAQRFVRRIARQASITYHKYERPSLIQSERIIETVRTCRSCLTPKPITDFYYKKDWGTYRYKCKLCCRSWFKTFPPKVLKGRTTRTELVYPYLVSNEAEGADLINLINKLVPRNMPELVRADVCQSLALAVLSGEIDPANLAEHIKEYAKTQYAFLPSKFQVSLDAPLFLDGRKYSLVDSISTDEYADRWASSRGFYGDAISDCESAEDYAERLRDAWEANRLTTRRRTYSEFSADHREDNRSRVAAGVSSARGGMYVNARRWRPIPPSRIGIERKLDELAYSTEDYLDHRIAEEAGRECSLDCFCRRHEQHSTNDFQQASNAESA